MTTENQSAGKPYFRCFVCDMQLHPAMDDRGDDLSIPVGNGTHWTSPGNYGPMIYDEENHRLEIVICDWCVLDRRERIREYIDGFTTRPADFSRVQGPGERPGATGISESQFPPIATDELGRIVPRGEAEWAARSAALSRAMRHAGERTDQSGEVPES